MRRGQRDRWTYDNNPHDQGIVTIPDFGNVKHFASVEELGHRDKTAGTIALLKKYGFFGGSFGKDPNYVPRTYKRQELPKPLHPNGFK